MLSVVNEREKQLILDLFLKHISEDEFLREFPIHPAGPSATGLSILEQSARVEDAKGVEYGLYLAYRFKINNDYLGVLCRLAQVDWHQCHEDVVDGLAILRSPTSVDALHHAAVAHYPYRDYDDAHSLRSKAIRALCAIQTPEALEKLGALLGSEDVFVASETRRLMERLVHSGSTSEVRATVSRLLESHDAV